MTELLLRAATLLDQAADALGDAVDDVPVDARRTADLALRCLDCCGEILSTTEPTEGRS